MALNIIDIQSIGPDSFPFYFFDANSWIAVLKKTSFGTESREQPYVDFFESIIALHAHKDTKQAKKIKVFPKIILTSLLLSEIINAYMRNVAMKAHYSVKGLNPNAYEFKRDFRSTPDYFQELKKLTSDIESFQDYVELMDDQFIKIDPYSLFSDLNSTSDFNDLYYYYFCFQNQLPIVTDDADFCFQDIPIITANPKLYKPK